MTWVAPRSWTTNEVVTSEQLNEQIRGNELSLLHYLDVATGDVDITNTNAETSLYSILVPANSITSTGFVLTELFGDLLTNNGTSDGFVLRVKWGGSTILTSGTVGPSGNTISATRRGWQLDVRVLAKGATNSQGIVARMSTESMGGGLTTGMGSGTGGIQYGSASVDTTSDQTLQVTAQWNATSANDSLRRRWALTRVGQN